MNVCKTYVKEGVVPRTTADAWTGGGATDDLLLEVWSVQGGVENACDDGGFVGLSGRYT